MTSRPARSKFLPLPLTVRPRRYVMRLVPNFSSFSFDGEQTVELEVLEATRRFVCHAVDLDIQQVSLITGGSDSPVAAEKIEFDESVEMVTFCFAKDIPPGTHVVLKMRWKGELNDKLKGFYRSSYKDEGSTKFMAVTQFEATYARMAFPCWDEPAFKAIFEVTLVVPADKIAISNMPVKSKHTESAANLVEYRYDASPVMSTYLLAFIVGEFDYISTLSKNGVRTSVYTRPGRSKMGDHALQVAAKALAYYEEEFGIKYPLPKSDLLAIPDFSAGAMENWGAVTYRESRLLVDQKTTTLAAKIRSTRTVCHELAHMWFGNLTTMKWWTHLWLNEGFARFMEFGAVEHVFPHWQIWDYFVQQVHGVALSLDALKTTHPVEVDVKSPDEVTEIFDTISYAKGASVIRMLSAFLGHKTFMKGVKSYLEKYAYSNAETPDLWNALSKASGTDVKAVMHEWTSAPGYPVVCIEEVKNGGQDGDKQGKMRSFRCTQKRFLSSGDEEEGEDGAGSSLWKIPLKISTGHGKEAKHTSKLLANQSETITIEAAAGEAICFNDGQIGFYRCCLSEDLLLAAVKGTKGVNLLGVISDAFAMADAGYLPYTAALKVAKEAKGVETFAVVMELSDCLSSLLRRYDKNAQDDNEKAIHFGICGVICDIFAPLLDKFGWESKKSSSTADLSHDSTLRQYVIRTLGVAHHKAVVDELKKRFWNGWESVPAEYLRLCFSTVVRQDGEKGYQAVKDIYENADSALLSRHALVALGKSPEKKLQEKSLDWGTDGKSVRAQDVRWILASVTKTAPQVVWEWFGKNFERLEKDYSGLKVYQAIIGNLTPNFNTTKHQEVLHAFAAEKKLLSVRAVKQTLERISILEKRRKREFSLLKNYFAKEHQT